MSRNLCVSRINQKQCKDKSEHGSTPAKQCGKAKGTRNDFSSENQQCCKKGSQGSNAQSNPSKPKPEASVPSFCRKAQGGGCDQKPNEIKKPCEDKTERDSAPEKQQCGKTKRAQNDFSSKKQQCGRKRSQGPKAEQCSSNPKSEADMTSSCKQAQEECDQKLHEIKKTVCQAVCETRKIRKIVETNMQSKSSDENSQGMCTSPPGKSTCKYKKLTTFLNIIGLAFLANIAYCIYKHGEKKDNEQKGDENSDERT